MIVTKAALKNQVMVILLAVALVVFGIMAIFTLGVEEFPEMNIPYASVRVVYPGADAETVEREITEKLEESLGTLDIIKHLKSTSREGVSTLSVEFKESVDPDSAMQELREKVGNIESQLPEESERAVISKFNLDELPVISVAVRGPAGEGIEKLSTIAEKEIKNRLLAVEGVASVDLYGAREKEIRVILDSKRLAALALSPNLIIDKIRRGTLDLPGGKIKENGGTHELSVRGSAKINSEGKLSNLPIGQKGDTTLRLSDVAVVREVLEEQDTAAMINATDAVSLNVIKQSGANIVKMVRRVKKELETISSSLPEGYSISVISDTSPYVESAVMSTVNDIFLGAILAMLIVYIFLMNKRASLIIFLTLPTSIIGTFLFVKAMGFTLNMMTTMALSLSVGILTDDAIVVVENIFSHFAKGKSRIQAVIDATSEVGLAVIATSLTLMVVFGPTVMIEGLTGEIFKQFGLTVIFAILISTVIALTLTAVLSAKLLKEEKKGPFFTWLDRMICRLESGYAKWVRWTLDHRLIVFLISIAIFAGGIKLTGNIKKTFFEKSDKGEITATLELEPNASMDYAKILARKVIEKTSDFKWQIFSYTTIGGSNGKNFVTVKIKTVHKSKRNLTIDEMTDQLRKSLLPLAERYNSILSVGSASKGGGKSKDISFYIKGNDTRSLRTAREKSVAFMKSTGIFVDIETSDKALSPELKITLDHDKINRAGLSSSGVLSNVRDLLSCRKAASFRSEGDERDVNVCLGEGSKKREELSSIVVGVKNNRAILLEDVADIGYSTAENEIRRQDRRRAVEISANLSDGKSLGDATPVITRYLKTNLQSGLSWKLSGNAKNMQESFKSLLQVLFVAIFLIYIVLASQFDSFIHPLTIMSALPFAVSGALLTIFMMDLTLSIIGYIGIIMLMGIVTKNSILLVDYAILKEREGIPVVEALVESAKKRLRPILMTALGTLFGMFPVMFSTGDGAETKYPMGWAVGGGLIFSTCVTLFIVPVIYSFFSGLVKKRRGDEQTAKVQGENILQAGAKS